MSAYRVVVAVVLCGVMLVACGGLQPEDPVLALKQGGAATATLKTVTATLKVTKGTITFHIDRASFPNWDDTTQVRAYDLKGDELSWKVPPRPDGSIPVTRLRRVR